MHSLYLVRCDTRRPAESRALGSVHLLAQLPRDAPLVAQLGSAARRGGCHELPEQPRIARPASGYFLSACKLFWKASSLAPLRVSSVAPAAVLQAALCCYPFLSFLRPLNSKVRVAAATVMGGRATEPPATARLLGAQARLCTSLSCCSIVSQASGRPQLTRPTAPASDRQTSAAAPLCLAVKCRQAVDTLGQARWSVLHLPAAAGQRRLGAPRRRLEWWCQQQ